MVSPDAPTGLQLDLLCAIARIEQVAGELESCSTTAERLATCDAPRLRRYLTADTLAWEAAQLVSEYEADDQDRIHRDEDDCDCDQCFIQLLQQLHRRSGQPERG